MIEVEHVSKWYGSVHAVRDLSTRIQPGVVTGLLGPNGAGKTTLIRMITGYLAPTEGRVRVMGHDTVDASDKARAAIGYLPESAPLYPEMSVEGYLLFRARTFGVASRERTPAIERALERCWLTEMRRRRIGALSKGYRQRVGLAAAILHNPAVLILDEPTSGLDPTQIRAMRDLIRSLAQGRTVLLSSHILPEVEMTCDRVLIVAGGRLRADGAPAELLASAKGSVVIGVAPSSADAAAVWRGVMGVERVEAIGPARWRLWARDGADPPSREHLARAAAHAGITIIELTPERDSLEQVFMRVIQSEPGAAAAAGDAGVAA